MRIANPPDQWFQMILRNIWNSKEEFKFIAFCMSSQQIFSGAFTAFQYQMVS
jgi:hypothetical protein